MDRTLDQDNINAFLLGLMLTGVAAYKQCPMYEVPTEYMDVAVRLIPVHVGIESIPKSMLFHGHLLIDGGYLLHPEFVGVYEWTGPAPAAAPTTTAG